MANSQMIFPSKPPLYNGFSSQPRLKKPEGTRYGLTEPPREWWFPFATFLRAFGTWSWWMYSAAQQTLRRWNMTAPNAWSEPWISYNGIYKKLVSSIIGIKKIGMYFFGKDPPIHFKRLAYSTTHPRVTQYYSMSRAIHRAFTNSYKF